MSNDDAIVSCVTLTGSEYVAMLAQAAELAKEITSLLNRLADERTENMRLREALSADTQTLRLHLGEMTAQEMRTLKAGFAWVLSRAALAAQPALGEVEQAMRDATMGGAGFLLDGKRLDPSEVYVSPQPAPSGWRPIETAPKTRDDNRFGPLIVLASTSGHRAIGYWGERCGRWGWVNPNDHQIMDYWNAFTHWMPLPPPAPGKEEA